MAAFVAAIPALISAGVGIWQTLKANKLAKEERPDYQIPQSEKDALSIAQQLATQRELPGQDIMEQNIRSGTASGISRMTEVADSPAMLLGNIANMVGKENQSMNELGIAAANYYTQNQRNLQSSLQRMGQQELSKWQYDEMKPYEEAMHAAATMREGGLQNIVGGVKGAVAGVMSANQNAQIAEQNKEYMGILKDYYKSLGGVDVNKIETDVNNNAVTTASEIIGNLLGSSKSPEQTMKSILDNLPVQPESLVAGGDGFPEQTMKSILDNLPVQPESLVAGGDGFPEQKTAITSKNYGGGAGDGSSMGEAQGTSVKTLLGGGFTGGIGSGNAKSESLGVTNKLTEKQANTFSNDEIYERLNLIYGGGYWAKGNNDGKTPLEVTRYTKDEVIELLKDPEFKKKAIIDLLEGWNRYYEIYQEWWNER
jgi:hypothetical protein